jgi:murein DD-endopeptidase MepM/ murein hydrolase activator NlpD
MLFIAACLIVANIAIGIFVYMNLIAPDSDSNDYIREWLRQPESRPRLTTEHNAPCAGAPFLLPSTGFIGLLYADPARPYSGLRRHTGIDIFGDGGVGEVPIYAAYDGYLTRQDGWLSTVIIRHDDPLEAGRTIWTYYTHMANEAATESYVDPAFPPGTEEVFVAQGTLLGYQGDYNGTGPRIATHLHFSIVLSDDEGGFRNEAILANTLDPSPYFGLPLNIDDTPSRPIRCNGLG